MLTAFTARPGKGAYNFPQTALLFRVGEQALYLQGRGQGSSRERWVELLEAAELRPAGPSDGASCSPELRGRGVGVRMAFGATDRWHGRVLRAATGRGRARCVQACAGRREDPGLLRQLRLSANPG